MELDIQHLQKWIGKTQVLTDSMPLFPLRALSATLDYRRLEFTPGASIPPLWHWLYFLPTAAQNELSEDGHARRGGFLPPVPLPRRMWAGGRLEFARALSAGEVVERRSTIRSVNSKEGRSGSLVFVCVAHEIFDSHGLVLSEEHDIVYRENAGAAGAPMSTVIADQRKADFSRKVNADITLLFRYSALTFNSHRIHYDHDYATRIEGYGGLVVHGPLLATLLMEMLLEQLAGCNVVRFSFKALHPVFAGQDFFLNGSLQDRTVQLWIVDRAGRLCMDANAVIDPGISKSS
ncbi:MAG: MaoC family dehydratase N-terminal domain-containing protein [Pseudohongiellaceae bacterium]